MRWGPKAITALLALACAWGAACGGGGGHDTVTVTTQTAFPQGFLPVLLDGATGRGDVAFRGQGELFAVAGTVDLWAVSGMNGAVTKHENLGAGTLLSITDNDGRLYVGNAAGEIWRITGSGTTESPFAATLYRSTGSGAVTGLAFAPSGFGDFGGSLFAAKGTSGIRRVIISDTPTDAPFADGNYVDLAFSGTTLLAIAIDAANDTNRIVTVSASGDVAPLPSTPDFVNPVGITVDSTASEIYVADAGDGRLYTVPVTGGSRTARAAYSFDSDASSGLAYDGIGAIAFITTDPPAIRGSVLPRIDPENQNFVGIIPGPTVGYGDLELDRAGAFVLAANQNDPNSTTDITNNFLFSVPRDASGFTTFSLDRNIVSAADDLLGVAVDPINQEIYFSSRLGKIYKRDANGTVSELPLPVEPSDPPPVILGLELVPDDWGRPSDLLVATTDDGRMFEIDPMDPLNSEEVSLNPDPPLNSDSHLSDLVFSSEGTLYVLDNEGSTDSRVLIVSPNGGVDDLVVDPDEAAQLGRPDGIEIDEGGNRLLVTSQTSAGDQLLAVDIDTGDVTALQDISTDDGFFPTGVIYDRLGTAVVRKGNNSAGLQAKSVFPVP
jgi:sugar lactone lactonase YvrE